MKEDLLKMLLELIRDVKSRKFVISVGFTALVVCNSVYALELSIWELVVSVVPASLFIIVEGIADVRNR